ncbi:Uncharacterised protein [Burkholderia pseudomallei]|nr:Uncharacterised protein [Burkholderia pseudomallei]
MTITTEILWSNFRSKSAKIFWRIVAIIMVARVGTTRSFQS